MAQEKKTDTRIDDAAAKGFGEQLREAREAAGISLGDMAVRSRLSVGQLRALESEDVASLPEPVYVRAFIRGCAQTLGLDPKALQDDYMRRYAGLGAANVGQVPDANPDDEFVINRSPRRRALKLVAFLLFLLILGAGGWCVYKDCWVPADRESEAAKIMKGIDEKVEPQSASAVRSEPAEAAKDADPAARKDVVPSSPSVQAAESAAPAEAPRAPTPAPAAAPAPQTAPAPAVEPAPAAVEKTAPAAADRTLRIVAEGTAWVEVARPDGRRAVAREMHAGDVREVTVPAGSRFTIGNPHAVRLTVDGAAYDFSSSVRSGVARFTLK